MNNFKKIIITFTLIVALIPIAHSRQKYANINNPTSKNISSNDTVSKNKEVQVETNSMAADDVKKLINEEYEAKNKDITNILLIGVDGEGKDRGDRSDSMMILTVDNKYKNMKITSLARDTYVDIKGHGTEKLTHAHAYGGVDLLLDTINNNFGLKIEKYAVVNFKSFMNVIDIIGGVEVNVTENDLEMLNKYIAECYFVMNEDDGGSYKLISNPGVQNLNGYQALAFSRIRYQDSALKRDQRQREVVQAGIDKVSKAGISGYMKVARQALKSTKTNLSIAEITTLGYRALNIGTSDIRTMSFPVYKDFETFEGKGAVVTWDKVPNLKVLNGFIYNNKDIK